MVKSKGNCPECNSRLFLQKTWKSVFLRCRSCNSRFPVEKFIELMDDFLEDQLANVRCDKIWWRRKNSHLLRFSARPDFWCAICTISSLSKH